MKMSLEKLYPNRTNDSKIPTLEMASQIWLLLKKLRNN